MIEINMLIEFKTGNKRKRLLLHSHGTINCLVEQSTLKFNVDCKTVRRVQENVENEGSKG